MDFDLGDEHVAIRETVRSFAETEVAPVAEELDREKRFPLELVGRLAELGLMGVPMPERYGGAGADTLAYAITVEELTRVDSSLGVTVAAHTSLGTSPILLFGSDEQKDRLLPDLCSGRALAAFGLTEPEAGSDAGNTRTRAVEQPDGSWVIDGEKMFITNAGTPISRVVTITARTGDDEISNLAGRERHAGLRARAAAAQDGLARVRHAPARLPGLPRGRRRAARAARARAAAVPGDPRRRAHLDRRHGARPGAGRVRAGAAPTPASATPSAGRSAASRRCSSSSPTWRRRSPRAAT